MLGVSMLGVVSDGESDYARGAALPTGLLEVPRRWGWLGAHGVHSRGQRKDLPAITLPV